MPNRTKFVLIPCLFQGLCGTVNFSSLTRLSQLLMPITDVDVSAGKFYGLLLHRMRVVCKLRANHQSNDHVLAPIQLSSMKATILALVEFLHIHPSLADAIGWHKKSEIP
ncbi:hypothetical protein ACMFMG_003917 [Clarireedia jacksonii]